MRIAHISSTFPPYRGGTGTVCYHNALEVARLGHEVHVFTANYGVIKSTDTDADPPGVTVHRLRSLVRVGNAPLLPGLLRVGRFDVLHLHYPFIFGAELISFRSLIGRIPTVITYHQDVILGGVTGRGILIHEALFGKAMLRRARRLLFTSMDYARASRVKSLVEKMGSAEGTDRVGEMPNGVDPTLFNPQIDAGFLRDRYGLNSTDLVTLFVGGLDKAHYFKGVPVLLQAMTRIPDPQAKLLIVGDGDLRPTFQTQVIELGLSGRVIFCGRVPQDELPAHYALSDLLVLPSVTMGEAFGIVLLEAMACAKPAIATNLPGVRTVVIDGENGLIVPPNDVEKLADALRSLLSDPERRRRMGENGRAKVEARYSWERIGRALVEVYEAVGGGR